MQDRQLAEGGRLSLRAALNPDLNLIARASSAAILALIALAANFLGSTAFATLVALLAALMAWEWSQVVRQGRQPLLLVAHIATIAVAALLAASGQMAFALLALAAGVLVVRSADVEATGFLSSAGVVYIGLPTLALIWLRADETFGALVIVYLFSIVWAADIGAFGAGRFFGGARLWPRVSPNKTWAGLIGGIIASTVLGALFTGLVPHASPLWLAACALLFGAMAQIGDLLESALKRSCGVKDASELIPGHGGFMDRLDSLVAVALTAGLLALVFGPDSPARAILLGH